MRQEQGHEAKEEQKAKHRNDPFVAIHYREIAEG